MARTYHWDGRRDSSFAGIALLKIAFFLPSLSGGGAERVAVNLLAALQSYDVSCDLVLSEATGPYLEQVPSQVAVIDLGRRRVSRSVLALRRYIKQHRPDVVVSHLSHANIANMMSRWFSRSKTRRVLVEHLTMSAYEGTVKRDRWIRPLAKRLYRRADAVVAVSHGAARDLEQQLHLPDDSVQVIHNPVVGEELFRLATERANHPWFHEEGPPVVLGVGRLTPQKDFATLIQAIGILRQRMPVRLVIVGDGEERDDLHELVRSLQLEDCVDLPGFIENPYALMARAGCLALSSRWEALPTVLIEALATGCPVVATDCPTGPAEILESGRYGSLVPMQSPEALAEAIGEALQNSLDKQTLVDRGREFSFERAAQEYYELFQQICGQSPD